MSLQTIIKIIINAKEAFGVIIVGALIWAAGGFVNNQEVILAGRVVVLIGALLVIFLNLK